MGKMKRTFMRILAVSLAVWMAVTAVPMLPVQASEPEESVALDGPDADLADEVDQEETSETEGDPEEENDPETEGDSETEEESGKDSDEEFFEGDYIEEGFLSQDGYDPSESGEESEYPLNNHIIYTELDPVDFSSGQFVYSDYSFYLSESERDFYSDSDSNYDSRDYSYVTSVKNQGSYGTCWAHAAIAGVEGNILKKGLCEDSGTLNLSEHHAAYFTYYSQTDPLGLAEGDYLEPNYAKAEKESEKNYLGFGGDIGYAGSFLMNWEGPVDETVAPYQKDGASITGLDSTIAYTDTAYHVQGVYSAAMNDIAAVKKLVVQYGAVGTSYCHKKIEGNNYYYYKDKKSYFYSEEENGTNHAVTIVGWDDNYSASNFSGLNGKKPSRDGAWIIKNSWGTGALDKGYFYLSYYEGSTYLKSIGYAFDVEPADNYDNNYHYDGLPHFGYSVINNSNSKSYANIFTASASETELVEAVGVNFRNTNTKYTIHVYKGCSSPGKDVLNGSDMGELVCTMQGTALYAGYYTIPLPEDKKFEVEMGESYAVAVTVEKGVYFPYVTDYVKTENYYLFHNQAAKASYSQIQGASGWNRFDNGDFCIKAYTSNVKVSFESVSATVIDHESFEIKWSRVAGGDFYEIYARPVDSDNGEEELLKTVASVNGQKDYSVTLSGAEGSSYRIYIKAKNKKHEIISNEVLVVLPKRKELKVINEPNVTLKAGQKLKEGTAEDALFAEAEEGKKYTLDDGILTWSQPEQIYTVAGEYKAEYIFKPDSAMIKSFTGSANVTVEKVKPKILVGGFDIEETGDKVDANISINVINPYNKDMAFSSLQWELTLEDNAGNAVLGPMNGEAENADRFTCKVVVDHLDLDKTYRIRVKISSPEYEECEITEEILLKKDLNIAEIGILNEDGVKTEGMAFNFIKEKTIHLEAIAMNRQGRKIDFSELEYLPDVAWTVSDPQAAVLKTDSRNGAYITVNKAGTINVTAKLNYDQKEYRKTITILVAAPAIQLSAEKVTINLQNIVRSSNPFQVQANHGMDIKGIDVTEIKKGKEVIDPLALEMVSAGGEYALKLKDGRSLAKGAYKVTLTVYSSALLFSSTEPVFQIDQKNSYRYIKIITLNVTDTKPNIKIGKPSINLFYTDGYTRKAQVSSINGKIEGITALNDAAGFADYFTFSQNAFDGEWYVTYKPSADYKKSSMKGQILVKVEGYQELQQKTITIATPTKKPSIIQSVIPVLQLDKDMLDVRKYSAPVELYDNTNKCAFTDYSLTTKGAVGTIDIRKEETGFYYFYIMGGRYYIGRTIPIKVDIMKENFKEPVTVTLKVSTAVAKPKVKASKSTIQLNVNKQFLSQDPEKSPRESVKLSLQSSQGNVPVRDMGEWKVYYYNPLSKKYEAVSGYDRGKNLFTVKGIELKYDPNKKEMNVALADPSMQPVGNYKIRIMPLISEYGNVYTDLTVKVVDKPITATVKSSGSLNLLDRANSSVKLMPSVKNSQAEITAVYVVDSGIGKYFSLYYNASKKTFSLKAKEGMKLGAGGYYLVPVTVELSNGMMVGTTAKVMTKLAAPKLKCPSSVTLSKYFGTGNLEMDFNDYIPAEYAVERIEVVSISKPVLQVTSDKERLNIGIADYSCKNGNYTVTVKIYYHGDDLEAKPVTKKIAVKVKD